MRKLLKSTIGAMAVGLGMMMVVGCSTAVSGMPEVSEEPTLTEYTIIYDTPIGTIDSEKILAPNRESAIQKAKKPEPKLGNFTAEDCGGTYEEEMTSLISFNGWNDEPKEEGKQITLTAKWKLANDFTSFDGIFDKGYEFYGKELDANNTTYGKKCPYTFFLIYEKEGSLLPKESPSGPTIKGYRFEVITNLGDVKKETQIPEGTIVELKITKQEIK